MRVFVALALLGVAAAVSCGDAVPAAPSSYEDTVGAMAKLASADLPKDYQDRLEASKKPGDFDPMAYFGALRHLSMEKGYRLDYVYSWESLGAQPQIYALRDGEAPLASYEALKQKLEEGGIEASDLNPCEHVKGDGTPESFFELAVLRIMGNQFYLVWHANYNDSAPVCGKETLEGILEAVKKPDFGMAMSPEAMKRARALDLAPAVKLDKEKATVSLVTFTKWGGFARATFTFRRAFPHAILDSDSEILVPYSCGVSF